MTATVVVVIVAACHSTPSHKALALWVSCHCWCSLVLETPVLLAYFSRSSVHIYYCTTGRAIWRNIQLEGGSIGPTEGRDNTEPES